MKYIVNIILLLLVMMIGLMFGDGFIHPVEIVKSFAGQSDTYTNLIIRSLRLPRVLLAIIKRCYAWCSRMFAAANY